jgi:hypothetical protein
MEPDTGPSAWRGAIEIGAGLKKFWSSSGTPKIRMAPELSPVTWVDDNKVDRYFKNALLPI